VVEDGVCAYGYVTPQAGLLEELRTCGPGPIGLFFNYVGGSRSYTDNDRPYHFAHQI